MFQENFYLIICLISLFVVGLLYIIKKNYDKWRIRKFDKFKYEFLEVPTFLTKKIKKNSLNHSLEKTSELYQKTNVDRIILIHGTFAGDDPLFFTSTFEKKTPESFNSFHRIMRKTSKGSFDLIGQDKGNFTNKHIEILNKKFDQEVSLFNWSGSNTHLARLKAVSELINELCEYLALGEKEFLILAHSHGGQILALLSQFMSNKEMLKKLEKEKFLEASTLLLIKKLKTVKFNLVSLGTPVRYPWRQSKNIKILHIINHRGKLPQGGSILSSLWTSGGDYVQQYGGAGSDYSSLLDLNKAANKKLKFIFNEENISFFNFLKRKERLHNEGKHLLVDYKDSRFYPNFYSSVFGHAVYTRYHLLSFHLELIYKNLNL